MDRRWRLAAAALLILAAALPFLESLLLGDVFSARRGGWLAAAVQQGPYVCVLLALLACARGAGWLRFGLPPLSRDRWVSFFTRGVPVVDARTVGIYRIVFAIGLLVVVRDHHIDDHRALQMATQVAIVLFALGLLARAALVTASIGVFFWMFEWTREFGSHPVSTLVVALPCMWPARWSDAVSLDAVMRRREERPPSAAYGYAMWAPLVVLGVALAAAALAKVVTPEWIANGTVRYAFVADYPRASVDWGLKIASNSGLAVAASALAVITEAIVITAAFSRSWVYRLVIGLAGSALFAGFYLMQGELWSGWWLLFTGVLPWELLSRGQARGSVAGITTPQWIAMMLLVCLQTAASAARLEIRPAISAYDMYSTTFRSPQAFDRANPMYRYRFLVLTGTNARVDVTDCFGRPGRPEVARAWREDLPRLRRSLATCDQAVPKDVSELALFESLEAFDWTTGAFYWKHRDREVWRVTLPPK